MFNTCGGLSAIKSILCYEYTHKSKALNQCNDLMNYLIRFNALIDVLWTLEDNPKQTIYSYIRLIKSKFELDLVLHYIVIWYNLI